MPTPKRWYPKSRDFNDDPEGWELTDTFGDRTVRLWDEICAILDKTENHWQLTIGQWDDVLARKVKLSKQTVRAAMQWMLDKRWLETSSQVPELEIERGVEAKLEDEFFVKLNDPTAVRQVKISSGIVDIMTTTAIYEIKARLYRWAILRAIGQLMAYKSEYPNHDLFLVGYPTQDLKSLRATLINQGITVLADVRDPEAKPVFSVSAPAGLPKNSYPTLAQPVISSPNYWKFHKKQEPKRDFKDSAPVRHKVPSYPNLPNLPNLQEDKIPLKRKNKTPWPENFSLADGLRAWAVGQQCADPDGQFEAFRDYHQSHGSRFIDWDAAFRTWIRNSFKFAGRPTPLAANDVSERIKRSLLRGL